MGMRRRRASRGSGGVEAHRPSAMRGARKARQAVGAMGSGGSQSLSRCSLGLPLDSHFLVFFCCSILLICLLFCHFSHPLMQLFTISFNTFFRVNSLALFAVALMTYIPSHFRVPSFRTPKRHRYVALFPLRPRTCVALALIELINHSVSGPRARPDKSCEPQLLLSLSPQLCGDQN